MVLYYGTQLQNAVLKMDEKTREMITSRVQDGKYVWRDIIRQAERDVASGKVPPSLLTETLEYLDVNMRMDMRDLVAASSYSYAAYANENLGTTHLYIDEVYMDMEDCKSEVCNYIEYIMDRDFRWFKRLILCRK